MLPIKLSIENFLSHDKSDIDFNKFQVALITGTYNGETEISNGAGKSALIDGIVWALFGKSRHKKKDGIVKKDKRHCKVEFIFNVNETIYKITRRRDKIIGEADVVFEQLEGSEYKNISCDTNTATDDKITEVLNVNYEVFLNSVYFKQNDISIFAEATSSKRKDTIKSLLKMDVWDEYQQKAKDATKNLSGKLEEKKKLLVSDDLEDQINTLKEEIKKIKGAIETNNIEYSKLNAEVISKTSNRQVMMSSLELAPEQLKKLQKEHSEFKKRFGQITLKLNENKNIIGANEKSVSDLQQKITQLNDKIKAKKDIDLADINGKLIAGKTKEKVLREQINHLQQDISFGDVCPTCDTQLTKEELKNLKVKRQQNLEELKARHSEILAKLNRAQEKTKQMTFLLEEGNRAEIDKSKLEVKLLKIRALISTAITENNQFSTELKKNQDRNFEKEINEIKALFDKSGLNKIEEEIQTINNNISIIRSLNDKLNVDLGSKARTKEELERTTKEQEELEKEIKQLNEDFIIYDKLKQYFGKDGIQSVIIENVIEELENYTNDTLNKICNEPTSIAIKTQKQSDGGSWVETFDIEINIGGRVDDFETLSGGEQFRVSLALRLSLSKILSKRMGGNLKFLLLDEVSSSLDDKGLKMFIDTVKQIGNDMKVLVITHDDKLKEQFDDIIVVNKTAEGSRASN
jgi:exonuclease SbcC